MAKSLEDGDFKGDLGGERGDNLPYYAIIETPKIWKITPSTSDSLRNERLNAENAMFWKPHRNETMCVYTRYNG